MKTYVLCFTLLVAGWTDSQPTDENLTKVLNEVQKKLKELEGIEKIIENLRTTKKPTTRETMQDMMKKLQRKKNEYAEIKNLSKLFAEAAAQVNTNLQDAFTNSFEKLTQAINKVENSTNTDLAPHVKENLIKMYELLNFSKYVPEKLKDFIITAQIDLSRKAKDLQNPYREN